MINSEQRRYHGDMLLPVQTFVIQKVNTILIVLLTGAVHFFLCADARVRE
jgi:hypothetical protein